MRGFETHFISISPNHWGSILIAFNQIILPEIDDIKVEMAFSRVLIISVLAVLQANSVSNNPTNIKTLIFHRMAIQFCIYYVLQNIFIIVILSLRLQFSVPYDYVIHFTGEAMQCLPNFTGRIPLGSDCHQFVSCFEGHGTIQNCTLGTFFNPETEECDSRPSAECSSIEEGNTRLRRSTSLSSPSAKKIRCGLWCVSENSACLCISFTSLFILWISRRAVWKSR